MKFGREVNNYSRPVILWLC